ncbi:dynein regulatory complex subunit 6 [Parambassis ranga]|uniref:Dynein regulatory complex subunit 6 n=1 Tax=Parambassis ranga TaxID=210632 RepID=A0A6P7IG42_9TELE|nr:dynein regulatory complex subunit 6 [Parambassis ranga]
MACHGVASTEPALEECDLPQLYKTLLTASCLSCPSDPILFLKNTLMTLQETDNLQDIDWYRFVADAEPCPATTFVTCRTPLDTDIMHLEKYELDKTKKHFERKCQLVAFTKWLTLVKLLKKKKGAAIKKLETLVNARRLKRIIGAWRVVTKDSIRTKEYFKKLEMSTNEEQQTEGHDGLSVLPSSLLLKIFQYLELRDRLTCAEVCCTWKTVVHSSTLWSQINVSVGKDWITDSTMKHILQSYRPFVTHLNLSGCTSLTWSSLKYMSECRNLQELNVSECFNVTDMMVQNITKGCSCLLYLNLSCTLITNATLKVLSRNCHNLQSLSLAYCCRITDKGFLYLTTGKGCRSLIHLNVSGCTQITVSGFKNMSVGCPLLKEIVINDMPTLSDSCVLALLSKCRSLSAISLLDAPHLSDIALTAIAEAAKLQSFSTEGNNQLTDASWTALCSSSEGLHRLHAAECPRMTDASLKSLASLRNLEYLDISLCNRVSDVGIQYLTNGSSATKLQELNISCIHITDISVMRIAQRLCTLYHLNLSHCKHLTDVAVGWLSGSSICSLDISGCNIHDKGLDALVGVNLKKLVLAECIYVTDIGIEKLCKNVRDLEHVDVSHCKALSDEAMRSFSFYCRDLVTMRMSGCPKMTDVAVQYLTSGSHYLRDLDVSGCVLLTDRTIRYLEIVCPPLRSITMACCSGISRTAALKLQSRVSYWEHSSDDPLCWFA